MIQADIFFFISSIAFIIFILLLTIAGVYFIQIVRNVAAITKKVERDIDTIGDTAKELVMDLQNSSIFSLLFGKRKKYNKKELSD